MSKREETISQADAKKERSKLHALSMLGGVVFFSVVVALAVSRNERVREEVDAQVKSFLETTRLALSQYQRLVLKIKRITTETKSVIADSKNKRGGNPGQEASEPSAAQDLLSPADEYDLLWAPVEDAVKAEQASRSSG
jgi:hypothetical protein